MAKAHKNTDFVLGRANPCLPRRGNCSRCRLGATVRDAASEQLFAMPPRGNSPLCRRVATLPSAAEWQLSDMPPSENSRARLNCS